MVSLNYITLFPFPCLFWNFLSYLQYLAMRIFKATYDFDEVCCLPMHFKCDVKENEKKVKKEKEKRHDASGASRRDARLK